MASGGIGEESRTLSLCLTYRSIPPIRCLGELLSAERNSYNERGAEQETRRAVHTTPAPGGTGLIKSLSTKNFNYKCLYLYLMGHADGGAVG